MINTEIFDLFNKRWALLTAGPKEDYNSMTIAWGELGTLWGKPVATVYVKKNRYTWEFMKRHDTFTISFYPDTMRQTLAYMGSTSGRDHNKVAESGLIPVEIDGGVTFEQAQTTIVCKKIYEQDMEMNAIPRDVRDQFYVNEPTHEMFIGEVVEIK